MTMSTTTAGIHTTTDPVGTGWVNQANGKVLSRHRKKARALVKGKRLAKQHGADLTVHRADGTVIATRSFAMSPI
jgi:hypothetical protein